MSIADFVTEFIETLPEHEQEEAAYYTITSLFDDSLETARKINKGLMRLQNEMGMFTEMYRRQN